MAETPEGCRGLAPLVSVVWMFGGSCTMCIDIITQVTYKERCTVLSEVNANVLVHLCVSVLYGSVTLTNL